MEQTREHIRLLSIFHYVLGGIGYLVSLIPVIHIIIGIMFLVSPPEAFTEIRISGENGQTQTEPGQVMTSPVFPGHLFGLLFTIVPAIIILAGFAISTCIVLAGRNLARYRNRTFCLVVAGIECLAMPLGTILGVFSILVLTKPEARELFGEALA